MSIPADIVLTIAAPPSANRLWRNFRGRMVKSDEYRAWKDEQAAAIAHQLGGARIEGYFAIAMLMPQSRMDLDNRVKPLLDAMQAGGAVVNDKRCMSLSAKVDHLREPGSVLAHLWAVDPPPPKGRKPKLRLAAPVESLRK